jgi:homoserine kinase type II
MSVYTPITRQQLIHFLTDYQLGELIKFSGIKEGIDNTNYRLTTTKGRYILTLFEKLTTKELPFFFDLLAYLQAGNIVCPQPQKNKNGKRILQLQSKAVAIFNCLEGHSILDPTEKQCAVIGFELGKIHRLGVHFPKKRTHDMGEAWIQKIFTRLKAKLVVDEREMISHYLSERDLEKINFLPRGIIHADLFKDNVLFKNNKITGILDFYLACEDHLLLDLAIACNDWCCDLQGQLHPKKINALVTAYQQQRSLAVIEKQCWSLMLQKAALIFWLSRLDYLHYSPAAELTLAKDPNLYKNIFIQHSQTKLSWE